MKKHVGELHITVGLPGSGKTTWAKDVIKSRILDGFHVECDTRHKDTSLTEHIKDRIYYMANITIIDGMFLTDEDVKKLLVVLRDEFVEIKKVILHVWDEDRESCMWNDLYRRDTDSAITISNAMIGDFKKEDIEGLKEVFENTKVKPLFKVEKHSVVRKPAWKVFSDKHQLYVGESGNISGDSWSNGGTWNDCWGGGGTVSSETPPDGMGELDRILESVAPDVTFLEYKNIRASCVSIDTYGENDYYGGCVNYSKYVLNVPTLYELLVEKEIITEIE